MAELGTYDVTYRPYSPYNALPQSDDIITHDWLEATAQWSQRFMRIATTATTLGAGISFTFDYSSLACDLHPPYLRSYVWNATGSFWVDPVEGVGAYGIDNNSNYFHFKQMGLGSAVFDNHASQSNRYLFIAYM